MSGRRGETWELTTPPELQQQLFAGVTAEDPHLLAELCVAHSNKTQTGGGRDATPTEQLKLRVQSYADVLQVRERTAVSMLDSSQAKV